MKNILLYKLGSPFVGKIDQTYLWVQQNSSQLLANLYWMNMLYYKRVKLEKWLLVILESYFCSLIILSVLATAPLNPPVKTGSEILTGNGSVFSKKLKAGNMTIK